MRRRALAALGAMPASLALAALQARAAPSTARPPVARKEPVRETLWGDEIADPYRWMENPKDPEWEPFMKGQAAYARRVLDAIPDR
jgi:prolyl oligopeptidase